METSEQTIRRVLSKYDVGAKIRELRLRKKLGLKELGAHTGLSPSLLSQIENGRLVPTLPTLARIAMVFDVGLEHFFLSRKPEKLFAVVRAAERIRLPETPSAGDPSYFFENLAFPAVDKGAEAYWAEFPFRSRPGTPHAHEGHEFIYVVRGAVSVVHAAESYVLSAGDSAYFDSTEPHSYQGTTQPPAQAVVVTFRCRR